MTSRSASVKAKIMKIFTLSEGFESKFTTQLLYDLSGIWYVMIATNYAQHYRSTRGKNISVITANQLLISTSFAIVFRLRTAG